MMAMGASGADVRHVLRSARAAASTFVRRASARSASACRTANRTASALRTAKRYFMPGAESTWRAVELAPRKSEK